MKIGGIDTFIKGFIKYSPEDFDIELIGVTENMTDRPPQKRLQMQYNGRSFFFYPLLYNSEPHVRTPIPLTAKFTLALRRKTFSLENKILEFHRLEPAIPFHLGKNSKLYFCHGNILNFTNPHVESRWRTFPAFYFLLEKFLINRMTRIFVVSETGLLFYKTRYKSIAERFHFFPTWVDDEIFFPYSFQMKAIQKKKASQEIGFTPDSLLLLFAGRLEKPKNPMLALEAFRRVSNTHPRAKLLIAGDGGLRAELQEIVDGSSLAEKVHFLGPLSQKGLAEIMRIADLLMLTSGFEGMPRIVLEGLACGLPVVSTNVGEVRKVVQDGYSGLVVNTSSPQAFANAVSSILSGEVHVSAQDCIKSIKKYSAKEVLEPLYEYYHRLNEIRFQKLSLDRP